MLEELEAAGFDIMKESLFAPSELGVGVVYVLDPDGVRVELIELPGDPTLPLGDPL
jgi:catechol 2,3-dioxygenase-like lactoylglutathione lyase family enzyme